MNADVEHDSGADGADMIAQVGTHGVRDGCIGNVQKGVNVIRHSVLLVVCPYWWIVAMSWIPLRDLEGRARTCLINKNEQGILKKRKMWTLDGYDGVLLFVVLLIEIA